MKLDILPNNIKILDKVCFVCNSTHNITNHHTIPKHMKPIKNVEIPLCDNCHKILHGNDTNTLIAFAYKIKKTLQKGVGHIDHLKNFLHKKKNTIEKTKGEYFKK